MKANIIEQVAKGMELIKQGCQTVDKWCGKCPFKKYCSELKDNPENWIIQK